MSTANPYLPQKAEIIDIIQETTSPDLDIKTFRLKLENGGGMDFMPGQFIQLSIPGVGEATFGFASSPLVKDSIELTIKKVGLVTEAVHCLKVGDYVWIRGPFGNTFPVEKFEGSKIFIVAGGLGLAPLRPLIKYMFGNRDKFKEIEMLLAARTPEDHVFRWELEDWRTARDTKITLTIDRPVEGWNEKVGFPHILVQDMDVDVNNTYAVLCGPPIMIKALSNALVEKGFPKDKIYTTLEMRMTCGMGKCGRCNIGHQYVCIDGPVFSMTELADMPNEY